MKPSFRFDFLCAMVNDRNGHKLSTQKDFHAESISTKTHEQLDIGNICKSWLYNLRKLLSGIVPVPEK
jgi:hypothetical protein